MSARLTARLSTPIMAVSCLPLLVGVYSAWEVHRSQQDASEALVINVASMRAAEEIAIGIRDVRACLDRFLLTGDRGSLREVPHLRRETDHWLDEARRAAVTPREQEQIAQLTRGYEHFFRGLEHIGQDGPEDSPAAVRELVKHTDEILRPAQEYLDDNEEDIQRSSWENLRLANRMVFGLLLLGGCGPVAGLLAGYGMARAVSRSVVRLSVPVRDAAGKLSEVVGPVTVSAGLGLEELEAVLRRMAEQIGNVIDRLQQSQREALRAEQLAAVGQMAAGVAHELRNPLMSMKILVQAAAEAGPTAGLEGRDLVVLEEEITRLEHLTSTLLDFARPPQLERRTFDVRGLLEETADLVSGRAGQRDVRIDCDLPEGPVWVEADPGQIRQVVLNLLLNALEAIQEGGTVQVRAEGPAELSEEEVRGGVVPLNPWLTIHVEDTGPGLPAELGRDIFTPFVSTKPTGIGLGLSICRRIAEAHGGEITAADRSGGGAVFSVRLPCRTHGNSRPVPALP